MACAAVFSYSQTSAFSYQGALKVSGSPANGNYDLQFKLFDASTGGTQIGPTNTINAVAVANGTFSVVLDFLNGNFPGPDRFLEVAAKTAGGASYTVLSPRSQVLSSPYSIKSLFSNTATTATTATDASQLGGVAANQYVQTTDPRLSDARPPTAGSSNYIQNQNAVVQASANMRIDGTATATNINAFQFYQLNGQRILFTGTGSLFVGPNIALNSTGINNSFFGNGAGNANTSGAANSFFGKSAGTANTIGQSNVFVGNGSGGQNLDGSFNVYVGQLAGQANVSGQANTFIGTNAGTSPATGSNNVAVGADSGNAPTLGSNNTFLGKGAIPNAPNLNFATAIGSGAVVGTSNTIVLGRSSDTTVIAGMLTIVNGAPGASSAVCATPQGSLGLCASSLRFKKDVETYRGGLDIVKQLRPITFNWNDGGISDVGFAAEEVNKVEPLLTVFNPKGEIHGVKYGQVTTVLVNAVKEQQVLIESQAKKIEDQQIQIDALKELVCSQNPTAAMCKK